MRISTEWLADYVRVPASEQLESVFQMAGLGVEEIEPIAEGGGDVFTLEVTSNRGDWLSATGLAREIGAMTEALVRFPAPDPNENGPAIEGRVVVDIEEPEDCPRYAARLIENVRVQPSPEWIQQRLTACGMRPINNIVDITNYVMLESGQPLHAFDAAKVVDADGVHRILVRRAQVGEQITTLDGIERELNSEVLCITDGRRPIAVAGVMGGADSEVTDGTTSILLESAHFNAGRVRRGRRSLELHTEASRRFERWVDPNGVQRALDRAAQLLQQDAPAGEFLIARGAVDRYGQPKLEASVTLRPARCNAILGLALSVDQITALLKRLGLKVANQTEDLIQVTVPTWRNDIQREVDLIEEVARVHGYNNIPSTLPRGINPASGRSLSQRLIERATNGLLRAGLNEVITYSLENAGAVERAGLADATDAVVKLRNPLSEDYTQLRTSLLPSLLQILERNDSGAPRSTPIRLFELGKIYLQRTTQRAGDAANIQPDERRNIGIALLDGTGPAHWQKEKAAALRVDFFTLKAIVDQLLETMGAPKARFRATRQAPFHPGRCAVVSIAGEDIGVLGELHPAIAERYDFKQRAYLASLDFEALVRHVKITQQLAPIPRYPAADRDLALVLPQSVTAAQIQDVLTRAGAPLLEDLRVFDLYTGPPIPEGFKSVGIALRLRGEDRTLTEDEIETSLLRARQAAESELQAQLRS